MNEWKGCNNNTEDCCCPHYGETWICAFKMFVVIIIMTFCLVVCEYMGVLENVYSTAHVSNCQNALADQMSCAFFMLTYSLVCIFWINSLRRVLQAAAAKKCVTGSLFFFFLFFCKCSTLCNMVNHIQRCCCYLYILLYKTVLNLKLILLFPSQCSSCFQRTDFTYSLLSAYSLCWKRKAVQLISSQSV